MQQMDLIYPLVQGALNSNTLVEVLLHSQNWREEELVASAILDQRDISRCDQMLYIDFLL